MSGPNERKDSKKVNGPWDKIKKNDSKQLRPPKNSTSDVSIPDTQETGEKEDGGNSQNMPQPTNKSFLNSTLNANAAEFIPLSNQNQNQNQNSDNHCQDDHSHDAIVLYLKDELNYLTLNPGKYDDVVQPLFDVLEPYVNDENALQTFISVIIDECISEPNLRYNGARLCSDLTTKFGIPFRTVLLKRCQEEHSLFVQNAYSNDGNFMNRIQGFGILLAELFLQIQIKGKSIRVLGQGLLKILQIILKNESEKGVKSVCQILKLAGKKLDEISSSNELDELFSRLQSISNYVDLDPNLRFIVNSVLDMRRSHWGENSVQQSVPEQAESNSEYFNDPVFFGPDGKIISEEETSFLQESVPFSEDNDDYVCEQELMDDEIMDDFQRFLKMKDC